MNKEVLKKRTDGEKRDKKEARELNEEFRLKEDQYQNDLYEMSMNKKSIIKDISHSAWRQQEHNQRQKKFLMKDGYLF